MINGNVTHIYQTLKYINISRSIMTKFIIYTGLILLLLVIVFYLSYFVFSKIDK